MTKQPLLYLLLLLLAPVMTQAQDAKISAHLSANRILVGDRTNLVIEVSHNQLQSKVQWAVLPDTVNNLELLKKGRIDTMQQGDMITYRQQVEVTGFDSGNFVLPPFQFSVIPNHGTAYTLQTDSLSLLVQTVAVDTTQEIHGIKEILPVTYNFSDEKNYLWIGGILVLLLIAVVVFIVMRAKKQPPPPAPEPPKEPITVRYLRQLDALENKKLWQSSQVKEYYIELTDLLRQYIEERFGTSALELTTDELIEKAKHHKEMNRHIALLENVLHTADLAKFAKAQPLPHEHTDALEAAKEFVATTKPVIIETTKPQ